LLCDDPFSVSSLSSIAEFASRIQLIDPFRIRALGARVPSKDWCFDPSDRSAPKPKSAMARIAVNID